MQLETLRLLSDLQRQSSEVHDGEEERGKKEEDGSKEEEAALGEGEIKVRTLIVQAIHQLFHLNH